jgi:hypothetical protein
MNVRSQISDPGQLKSSSFVAEPSSCTQMGHCCDDDAERDDDAEGDVEAERDWLSDAVLWHPLHTYNIRHDGVGDAPPHTTDVPAV